jgi:hypothetical protein
VITEIGDNFQIHSIWLCVALSVILSLKSQENGPISERLTVVCEDGISFGRVLSIRLVSEKMKNLKGMKRRFSNPI